MSATQQFFASGAGNGFPFCLPDATNEQVLKNFNELGFDLCQTSFSFQEAYDLFWKLKSYNLDVDFFTIDIDDGTDVVTVSGILRQVEGWIWDGESDPEIIEPFERVCEVRLSFLFTDTTDSVGSVFEFRICEISPEEGQRRFSVFYYINRESNFPGFVNPSNIDEFFDEGAVGILEFQITPNVNLELGIVYQSTPGVMRSNAQSDINAEMWEFE
jgi:hypothetical protein